MAKGFLATVSAWFAPHTIPGSSHAAEVITRHAEALMRMRGVMSVSMGRTEDGHPAILVGLENPLAVPENIPAEIEGVPVVHQDVKTPEA
ncbi:MAG: hypothetical protein EG823_06620 [Actinobacteria bacterium]|nr:hypothetical protein [Actinomycetota bacterium]